ncbi:MAG: adenylate/guanylate cyclase domain-containing protein [Gammaproteobacteria bacterium]
MARTENLTVMFTDIVDFTERTMRQSRAESEAMLANHDRMLLPLIARFGGRRVKSIGDALMVTFRSPTDALHCGMAMHDTLAEYNAARDAEKQIHLRVALNVGEVRVHRGDVFGEAVNVASRVEHLTPPNEIYFTEAVYLAMNKAEVPCATVGVQQLRGIPEPVKLFRIPPRKIARLVPGGEDLGNLPGELPFGGMHRTRAPREGFAALLDTGSRTRLRRVLAPLSRRLPELTAVPPPRRAIPLLAALAISGAGALWLHSAPTISSAVAPVESVAVRIDAEPAAAGQATLPLSPQAAHRQEALEWVKQGHRAFEQNRRLDAASAYGKALELLPELQHEPVVATRLVACLSWASELAVPLIRRYPSPEIIAALSARSGELGTRGAERAVALLEELGYADRIDPLYLATSDLGASTTCEGKRDAIRRLRALADPRGLPALRASVGSGVRDWLKNRCFRSDALAAIEEIEQAQAGDPG